MVRYAAGCSCGLLRGPRGPPETTCGQPVDRGEGGEVLRNSKAQGLPLLQYGAPLPLLGRRGSHTWCAGGLGLEH